MDAWLKPELLTINFPKCVERNNKQHGKDLTVQQRPWFVCYQPVSRASQVTANPELTPPVLPSENVN